MERRRRAVELYVRFDCSAADTMRGLGYPSSRGSLATWHREWLAEQQGGVAWARGERYGRYTLERRRRAVGFYVSHGRNLKRTIRHMGYPSHEVLAAWIDEPVPGERRIQVNEVPVERRRAAVRAVVAGGIWRSRSIILKTTRELPGEGRGANPDNLTAQERTIPVRGVHERTGRSVTMLAQRLGLPLGVHHCQPQVLARPDKNAPVLALIRDAFTASRQRYGYRRIHRELKSMGVVVSSKRVMRLMSVNGIVAPFKSSRRYGSYKGEIGKAPRNLVARDLHAANANQLWVTDITEMSIPAGKVYPPPILDRHDGMPVAWTIGTSPNAKPANTMLQRACTTLKPGQTPTIHSDRWPEWIRICKDHGITRSMSRKGCSPDNAAAEGFFGRLKQEFHHNRSFTGMTIDEFMAASTTTSPGIGTRESKPDSA